MIERFLWKTKTKSELFKYLDEKYSVVPFDTMFLNKFITSIYDDRRRVPCYIGISKGKEVIAEIHLFELGRNKPMKSPLFFKRTKMFIEWVNERKVNVDVSGIPVGISECVLCGTEILLFPDKKPVCESCYEIYEKGKEKVERDLSFENLSGEIENDSSIYTRNPEFIPFFPFKEFLRRYVPEKLFNKGAGDGLRLLKRISDMAYELHFLEGVIEGKKLIQGLNNGKISLNDFCQPEKEYQEKYAELMELMNKFYGKEE